jgi:hypothetical protein
MRVGILASGRMGAEPGTLFARARHEVVFSYARSKEKLNRLARDAGGQARPGTPREAADPPDHCISRMAARTKPPLKSSTTTLTSSARGKPVCWRCRR